MARFLSKTVPTRTNRWMIMRFGATIAYTLQVCLFFGFRPEKNKSFALPVSLDGFVLGEIWWNSSPEITRNCNKGFSQHKTLMKRAFCDALDSFFAIIMTDITVEIRPVKTTFFLPFRASIRSWKLQGRRDPVCCTRLRCRRQWKLVLPSNGWPETCNSLKHSSHRYAKCRVIRRAAGKPPSLRRRMAGENATLRTLATASSMRSLALKNQY